VQPCGACLPLWQCLASFLKNQFAIPRESQTVEFLTVPNEKFARTPQQFIRSNRTRNVRRRILPGVLFEPIALFRGTHIDFLHIVLLSTGHESAVINNTG